MKYFEFGKENEELMVLLHGGGTCYLGVLPTAKKIAEKYHVILFAYDGFNPSEPETEFRSVAWEARELEDYILQNYGGRVDILYALSYGCRTLMQVLEDNRLQITTTIADGMSLRDYPDIKSEALKDLYLVQAVPYWASFVVLELTTTVGWFAIIWKGVLPLKKRWVLAAPMLVAGIGFLLELILPLPFNGFASGFESLGWIVMFLGGIQAIKNDDKEAD